MLGCPYSHEQLRRSLAKLGLLGNECLALADASFLFLSSPGCPGPPVQR